MSEERDETKWTRTLKAQPAVHPSAPETQFVSVPLSSEPTAPRAVTFDAADLDEETRPSLGPPVLPHTEITQPSPWANEPTRTLGPSKAPDLGASDLRDDSLHRDVTIPADLHQPHPASKDPTVLLPTAKTRRKRKRRPQGVSWTAAKSGLAGLATALIISVVALFVALVSLL